MNKKDKNILKDIKRRVKEGLTLALVRSNGTVCCPDCYTGLDTETFKNPTCRRCGASYKIDDRYALVRRL